MNNKSTISEHLLVAFWKEEASEQERQQVEQWLAISEENERLFDQWKKAWQHAGAMADFEAIYVEANWQKVAERIKPVQETKQFRLFPAIWRYAAALLLLAAATFLILRQGPVEMLEVTASNEPLMVELPDGSQVWLNEQATLRYPERFDQERRQVELTGEAFFEVTHNPAKPFSVLADNTETRVLGTSFNLKEQAGSRLELILVTGKVRFSRLDDWEILAPGEKLTVNEQGELSKTQNDEANFMAWRTRKLVFDSTALHKVVEDVNRLYDANLSIASEAIRDCPLTTTFNNDSLDDVLATIRILFDATVEKTEDGYTITGAGCPSQ